MVFTVLDFFINAVQKEYMLLLTIPLVLVVIHRKPEDQLIHLSYSRILDGRYPKTLESASPVDHESRPQHAL